MTKTLTVELGQRSYPITIGQNLQPALAEHVSRYRTGKNNAFLITDASVAVALPSWVADFPVSHQCVLPAGETSKSITQLEVLLEAMATQRIDRSGVVVALGGGVIGDLAGFAAASYLRGIDFIQVPTTLLAMVDSSVGGKTGVNLKAGKNLAGAFWQPKAVLLDVDSLQTLPRREFAAGMAEVIKYGMLYDAALFDQLAQMPNPLSPEHPELPGIIARCCAIKAAIVKADETETAASGGRALLNLGHTFAHAIEQVAGYGTYLHGEAVAIGLQLATQLSQRLGLEVSGDDAVAVEQLLQQYQLPTTLAGDVDGQSPPTLSIDALMAAMQRDKKVRDGQLRFVAMSRIGDAKTVDSVSPELIRELWQAAQTA